MKYLFLGYFVIPLLLKLSMIMSRDTYSQLINFVHSNILYLGIFKTEEEAHEKWVNCKLDLAKSMKEELDLLNKNIYDNIIKIIKSMK